MLIAAKHKGFLGSLWNVGKSLLKKGGKALVKHGAKAVNDWIGGSDDGEDEDLLI